MKGVREIVRAGWILQCPFCNGEISYSLINIQSLPTPFFYAEQCNDVLLRRQDEIRSQDILLKYEHKRPPIVEFENLWMSILDEAPEAPCGGEFKLWSNVKCPRCRSEIPYNKGVLDLNLRIFEPKIVIVDKSIILGDSPEESWRVTVIPESVPSQQNHHTSY